MPNNQTIHEPESLVQPMRTKLIRGLVVVVIFTTVPVMNAATKIVKIGESGLRYFFNPTNTVIHTGDVIRWTNTVANPHDSTHRNTNGQAVLWGSPKLSNSPPNNTFSFTFTNSGSYPYYCLTHVLTHPEQTGTVLVVTMNLPPSVAITIPTNNTRFFEPARFSIVASAFDLDGSVAQVELFSGNTSLGIRTNTPYSMSLSNVAAGAYAFTAIATDDVGAQSTSSVVNVSVTAPPTITMTVLQTTQNGRFQLQISGGSAGQKCFIDACATLPNWGSILNTNFPNTTCPACPVIDFTDPTANLTQRFYRARVFP